MSSLCDLGHKATDPIIINVVKALDSSPEEVLNMPVDTVLAMLVMIIYNRNG